MLEVRNLRKTYGDVIAVDEISFEIGDEGNLVVLLGPSGCGKTTTLRMVAGLEEPDSGNVIFDGEDITDLPPQDRDVAMVFQSYALYTHMNVKENIEYPLDVRGYEDGEKDEKVREVSELLEISHLLDHEPKDLSGGEQQRVALARALVREPKIFLMDEPLSNVDAKRRLQMRADLKNLQKKLGITTLYVTHDQEEAMAVGDKIVVMNEGRLEQFGEPQEIYEEPGTKFVGGFIGTPSMNFFEGEVRNRAKEPVFKSENIELSLPTGSVEKLMEYEGVTLGIRPSCLDILDAEEDLTVPVKVYAIESLGNKAVVSVSMDDRIYKAVVEPDKIDFSMNEEVYLKFDPSKFHFYNNSDGERIEI